LGEKKDNGMEREASRSIAMGIPLILGDCCVEKEKKNIW